MYRLTQFNLVLLTHRVMITHDTDNTQNIEHYKHVFLVPTMHSFLSGVDFLFSDSDHLLSEVAWPEVTISTQ